MAKEMTGKCLCGKVTATLTPKEESFGACHCNRCRKWSGGILFTVDCGTDFEFPRESERNITTFDSSDWAERGFCRFCGTNIFYRLKGTHHTFISLGFVENSNDFQFSHQIFVEEKPNQYSFNENTKTMTGEEVFAAYQGNH